MEPVILRTPRLELSIPVATDVDAITEGCQDADIRRFTMLPNPYRREDAVRFVEQAPKWWADGSQIQLAVREASGFAGMIGIQHIAHGNGELGYWLPRNARGRGIATEAAGAVADWALSPDGLDLFRLEWRALSDNAGSVRVAEKLGFRFEGTLRQLVLTDDGRIDGLTASLLRTDDRAPQRWPLPH